MKKIILLGVAVLLCIPAVEAKKKKKVKVQVADTVTMTTAQKQSYALGANLGATVYDNFAKSGIFIDTAMFTNGLVDAFHNAVKLSEEEMKLAFAQINIIAEEYQKKKVADAKALATKFFEDNKKDSSVIETPSGLQYKVLKMGEGAKPQASDKVKVHYHGTTIDGTVFDSSVNRGEPVTFSLNQVISGWTEGLQLMPVGSKFKFFIPYDLAYDERGAGKIIPPYSTLIFEVELLEINPIEE